MPLTTWLRVSPVQFTGIKTLRKVCSVRFSEVPKNNSKAVEDSDLTLTFVFVEILLPPNPSCLSRFTRLLPEEFTPAERVRVRLVWLQMSGKILKPKNLFWKVVHLCWVILVFVALMNSIRWTTTANLFCLKQCSNRPSPWQKPVLFVNWTRGPPFYRLPIRFNRNTTRKDQWWITFTYLLLWWVDSTSFTSFWIFQIKKWTGSLPCTS